MIDTTAIFVALGVLAALPASAQDYSRNGFYLGIGPVGAAYTEIDDEVEDALEALGYAIDVDTDPAAGFEVFGGYRLHPNLALEAEFEMLAETDIDFAWFETLAELESWNVTGNVKVYPLTGRVQPFLLLGVGVMGFEVEDTVGLGLDASDTDFAARFGGGVDFYLTRNLALYASANYLLPTGDLEDLDYVSFGGGLQFRF